MSVRGLTKWLKQAKTGDQLILPALDREISAITSRRQIRTTTERGIALWGTAEHPVAQPIVRVTYRGVKA
jgi:hypothetical protein